MNRNLSYSLHINVKGYNQIKWIVIYYIHYILTEKDITNLCPII